MIAALRPPAHPSRHTFRGVLLDAPSRRVVLDIAALTVTVDGRTHDFAPLVVAQHVIPAHKGKDGRRVKARTVAANAEPRHETVSRAFAFAESEAARLGVKSFLVGLPEPSRNTLAHREARAAKANAEVEQ